MGKSSISIINNSHPPTLIKGAGGGEEGGVPTLTGNEEWINNWRKNVISVVTRDRVVDKILKDRIDKKNTCEKQFP